MIFRKETWADYRARVDEWHRWYAWRPVSWDGGWAWLEYVERRQISTGWSCDFYWEIRPLTAVAKTQEDE